MDQELPEEPEDNSSVPLESWGDTGGDNKPETGWDRWQERVSKYTAWVIVGMMILFIVLAGLSGYYKGWQRCDAECNKQLESCAMPVFSTLSQPSLPNNTIIKEIKVPIYETITEYVNVPGNCTNQTITVDESNSTYVIGLIRQLKACEYRTNYSNIFCQEELEECQNLTESLRGMLE